MAGLYLRVVLAVLVVEFTVTSSTQDVQLRFQGQVISTHGFLLRGMIGEDSTTSTGNIVECETHNTHCCSRRETGGSAAGNWFFPNGTEVPPANRSWDFYSTHGDRVMHLHRRRGGVSGIYHCRIPDTSGNDQDLYVGIYSTTTGKPNITSIEFEMIDVKVPTFTLTCISSTGPVEEVQWKRDHTVLQDNSTYSISQPTVVNTVSAIYHHTLTVTGSLPGEYECRVISNRPVIAGSTWIYTMSIHIQVFSPPPRILAHQISNTNAIGVSWTVNDSSTQCYIHLYYQAVGSQVQGSVKAQCSPPEIVIHNLQFGVEYNITMVAHSQYHIPSDPSESTVVTLITTPSPSPRTGHYTTTGTPGTTMYILSPSHTTTSLVPSQMPPRPLDNTRTCNVTSGIGTSASTGAVAAISTTVTFVVTLSIGCLSGALLYHIVTKLRARASEHHPGSAGGEQPVGPIYEDIPPVVSEKIELQENVSYGPVQH